MSTRLRRKAPVRGSGGLRYAKAPLRPLVFQTARRREPSRTFAGEGCYAVAVAGPSVPFVGAVASLLRIPHALTACPTARTTGSRACASPPSSRRLVPMPVCVCRDKLTLTLTATNGRNEMKQTESVIHSDREIMGGTLFRVTTLPRRPLSVSTCTGMDTRSAQ
jgi:hypothetical protein